ncbi:MAG: hypothetical protein KKH49_01530 [Candidatus Omnitrophica bacterium]|nr:hypothetical protein [Candidatus Omnitrophota bacterium]
MCKKLNLIGKKFLPSLFVVFALICFTVPLHAQEHPWTVMVYMAAGGDLQETALADSVIISAGGSEDVTTAVYLDGDGSDAPTLVSFVQTTVAANSASNYALILWNAASLYGGEGKLSIAEVREALTSLDGVSINLVGFDGGSMGMLESAYEIKDYADVMVASEKYQIPGTWPYQQILEELVADTEITAAQLSQTIVEKYEEDTDNADNTLSSVLLANYSTHDLAGTWYINSLQCGSDEGDCDAFFGGMDISETGVVEQWYGEEFESDDMPTKIYIDSDGFVWIDSDEYFYGFMSPDKKTVTATISDDDGYDTAQIIVLQKRDEDVDFTLSDLAGDWDMHSFRCDGYGNCGWSRGEANITSEGAMSWVNGTFEDSDGSAEDTNIYQLSINYEDEGTLWNGIVTVEEDTGFVPFGAMSQNKNVVVGTIEDEGEGGQSQIVILQKKNGVAFEQSDLEGYWSMHVLGCQFFYEYWQHIGASVPVTIDSGGYFYIGDVESRVTITGDGVVSLEEGGALLTEFSGTMSQDKEMIVINGGEGDASDTPYQFLVFQKIRDVSPIRSLADAVSDFADAALYTEPAHDDWDVIFAAQQRSGSYTDSGGNSVSRDLKGFAQGVSDYAKNEDIFQSAYDVNEAFDQCIIANHSSSSNKDNGLSIYFPRWYLDSVDSNYDNEHLSFLDDDVVEMCKGIYEDGTPYIQSWDNFLSTYISPPHELVSNHTGEWIFTRNISGGTTASSYVMVSSTVFPDDADPLLDDLGSYDTELWRAFRWNPTLEPAGYEEYPFNDFGDYVVEGELAAYYSEEGYNYMEPGAGLWLISRNDVTLDVIGSLQETNSPYEIYLYPDWNQIGTPFNFQIDWNTVEVSSYGEREGDVYGILSDENTFTSHMLWRYSNGNYSGSTVVAVMIPGEGYWIYSNDYATLWVNPVRSSISNDFIPLLEWTLTLFAKASGEEMPPPPPGGMEPESDEEGSSGGTSGCFIATACFGSPMSGEVSILRNFRDTYLLTNPIGQLFVSTYYRYSPKVADFIAKHEFLKVLVRTSLYPVVKSCKLAIED